MKWERLSIIVRIGLGLFAAFGAFGTWSIATHAKNSGDLFLALIALLFTVALVFGAVTGRFPDVQATAKAKRNGKK